MNLMFAEFPSTPHSELRQGVERKDDDAWQAKSSPTCETHSGDPSSIKQGALVTLFHGSHDFVVVMVIVIVTINLFECLVCAQVFMTTYEISILPILQRRKLREIRKFKKIIHNVCGYHYTESNVLIRNPIF